MKNHALTLLLLFLLLLPSWLTAQDHEVQVSPAGGVYAGAFPVTMTCDNPGLTIRYTLNGAVPNGKSARYSEPLMLSKRLESRSNIYKIPISPKNEFYLPDSVMKGIVIRAAAFDGQGNRVSPVVTQSYFIGSLDCNLHGLPVVSICADSLSLFAHDTGILVPGDLFDPKELDNSGNYAQHGREWEREVNVEFYADGNGGFNQRAGLRTHGGIRARRAQQKGLKIYARQEYGKKNFKYRIFEETELEKYKRLVLRPFRSASTPSGVNDWLANKIAAPLNMGTTLSRPVVLFLNGEYWGIYFIEEKPDERYLENHYVVDCNNVNIITFWSIADAGTSDEWKSLYNWMKEADLSDPAQYNLAAKKIDIPNIIDYFIYELFSANWDWPSNNARCWQVPNGQWHWVFYDGDCCFDNPEYPVYDAAAYTGMMWNTCELSTLFFRKLLESNTFKNQFLIRLGKLNNTLFSYEKTKPHLDRIHQLLKDEIPMQVKRFNYPQSVVQWEESCRKTDRFLSGRVKRFWQQTVDGFHLRNEKVLSIVCNTNRTLFRKDFRLLAMAEEECTAWMEVLDPKGNVIHGEYVFLYPGKNGLPVSIGNRPGVYVVKVGDAVHKITKISFAVPVLVLVTVAFAAFWLGSRIIRRKRSS